MNEEKSVLLVLSMDEWKSKVLKSDLPVVVEFYSPICQYCAMLTPVFRKLSVDYGNRMNFAMVDVNQNSGIAQGYGIMGTPTLKFLCAGRPIYEIVGYRPEEELRAEIDRVLKIHKRCIEKSIPFYV